MRADFCVIVFLLGVFENVFHNPSLNSEIESTKK